MARSRANILVVDDDDATRDGLVTLLASWGYDACSAADGSAALKICDQQLPSAIITDLMMPRINGLEFIKKLKSIRPEIVTIVYSAFGNSEMAANLLKAGAFFYLEKPFDLEELDRLVEIAMAVIAEEGKGR